MRKLFLGLLFLSAGSFPVHSQENFEDIFEEGAFETTVEQSQKQDESNRLEYLFGNTLLVDARGTWPVDRQAYSGVTSLGGKFFIKATKPEAGSLFTSFSYRQVLAAGTNDEFYRQAYNAQEWDPGVIDFSLSELHLSFDADKKVFFRAGTQLLSWGSSLFWSPSDFINLQKQEFGVGADLRQGKPGLRVHIPWESGNFFFFTDVSQVVKNKLVGDFAKQTGIGWRLDGVLSGWRLGTNGYFYPQGEESGFPLLQGGLDLTTSWGGADFYAETGTTVKKSGSWPWQVAVGGSRSWGDGGEWTLTLEGLWNAQGQKDQDIPSPGSPEFGTFQSLYWGQWYGWAQLKRTKLWDDRLGLTLAGLSNLSDRSWKATLQGDWTLPGFIPLSLIAGVTGGKKAREFTYQDQGPAFTLAVRSLVEF